MSTEKSFNIVAMKQELLVNSTDIMALKLFNQIEDPLIKQLEVNSIKENQTLLKVDIHLNPQKELIASVAFAYKYGTLNSRNHKGESFIMFGKYSDQILISDEYKNKDVNYLKNEFVDKNVKSILVPLMNKISKCLYDVTEETTNLPMGMDVFGKFLEQLKE